MRVAQRIEQVQPPMIPIIGKLISQHPGTISLGQGIVHYDPPDEIFQALRDSRSQKLHRYGDVCGESPLLGCIRNKLVLENQFNREEPTEVVFTAGSNMGFLNAILAIADIGDEIVLISPYYFNHQMAIEIAGCQATIVPSTSDYQLDLTAIEDAITDRTRAVVTVSPNNPTGAVYSSADLTHINELCRTQGIYHISDEAYEYFLYDNQEHFSPGSLPDASQHTVSLYTLSKAYGMAGWRAGYMVVPEHLLMAVKKIQDTNLVCPPKVSQVAAQAVLEVGAEWCSSKIEQFAKVRNTILQELSDLEDICRIPNPQGAFYMLLQLQTDLDDLQLVEALIRDFGVATLPGSTFGSPACCSIRISYGALAAETVLEGIGRLKHGLRHLLQ